MLAGNANPWHNIANPLDVNNDTTVGPVDALAIVNGLNWYGSGRLGESLASLVHSGAGEGGIASTAVASSATRTPQAMVDVDDDNLLTPMDALRVINELNEGEGPDLVRATVRMTTNVPVRADEVPVLDYVYTGPVLDPPYQARQDVDTVTLKTTDTANPTILLNVLVQDIRTDDGVFRDKNSDGIDDSDDFGVFSAYFDVTYDATAYTIPSGNANNSVNDPTKNDPTFPISYVNPKYRQVFGTGSNRVETEYENYPNGPSWEGWSTPGLIDEAGGFTGYPSSVYGRELPAVPAAKKEVFTVAHVFDVPLTVQSFLVGNDSYAVEEGQSTTLSVMENDTKIGSPTGVSYVFGINGADGTGHDLLVYGNTGQSVPNPDPENPQQSSIVPEDQVDFVNDSVKVVNNRTLSVSLFQAPTKGTVTPGANNTFVYTPTVQGPATDTFIYNVTDGVTTKRATVTINIGSVNDAPVLTVPAAQTTNEDTDKTFAAGAISVADPDAGTGQLQVTVNVPNVAAGTFSLGNPASGVVFTQGDGTRDTQMTFTGTLTQINNAFGAATFHPALNYNGSASVVISVNDQGNTGDIGGAKSDTETLAINVLAVNDAPVNTVPQTTQTAIETDPLSFTPPISVTDVEALAENKPVQVNMGVTNGKLNLGSTANLSNVTGLGTAAVSFRGNVAAVNAALNTLTYQANAFPQDDDTLTVTTSDLGTSPLPVMTATDQVPITVLPASQPAVVPDTVSVVEDSGPSTVNVLANDIDANGAAGPTNLKITAASDPAGGAVIVAADGKSLTYQPDHDFFGNEEFTYTIESTIPGEPGDGPSTGKVFVSVTGINDSPTIAGPASAVTDEDKAFTFSVPNNVVVADVDADVGGGVQVTVNASNGKLNAPNSTVTIGGANTKSLTITGLVAAVNNSLRSLTYTPDKDYFGADTVQFTVDDMGHTGGGAASHTATWSVPMTVNPDNDEPTIQAPQQAATKQDVDITFAQGTATEISVSDVDTAELTVGLVLQRDPLKPTEDPGNLKLSPMSGVVIIGGSDDSDAVTFTGTLAKVNAALNGLKFDVTTGYEGMPSVQISASDGEFTPMVTVGIIVAGINNPPENVLPQGPVQVAEDEELFFNGNLRVTDPDAGAVATVEVTLSATHGTLTPVPTQGVTVVPGSIKLIGSIPNINKALNGLKYEPDANYHGTAQLVISTNDKGNTGDPPTPAQTELIDTDTIAITVTPVNDPPVANDDGSPTDRTTILWNTVDNEFDVLANDNNGPDAGEPLETKIISNVDAANAHGTVTVQNGKLYYTPTAGYTGDAEIVYTLNDRADGTGLTDTATVYLAVVDFVPSDVSGHVYFDADNDGRVDTGEWGIGGVRVMLTGWNIQGHYDELTAWTDETGGYTFHDVLPSQAGQKYTLSQQQPMSMIDGKDTPGKAAAWKANDQFEIALPVFGFADPTVASNNNFAELGFRAEFAALGLYDLVHFGAGGGAGGGALVFGTDAAGNLQWYLNLGGWTNYVPGRQSPSGYQVSTQNGQLPLTDTQAAAVREVDAADAAIRSMYSPTGGAVMRILGEADDFELPLYQSAAVAEGEGEGISEISDAESLAANAGSYEAAVDAVLAGVA